MIADHRPKGTPIASFCLRVDMFGPNVTVLFGPYVTVLFGPNVIVLFESNLIVLFEPYVAVLIGPKVIVLFGPNVILRSSVGNKCYSSGVGAAFICITTVV